MKKMFIVIILSFAVMLASNNKPIIPKNVDIAMIAPAIVLALDKAEEDNNIRTTLFMSSIEDGSENKEDMSKANTAEENRKVLSSIKNTAPMAVERMQRKSDKSIPRGNIEYFLIGEAAVKDDLYKYIDFLGRNNEFRLTSRVFFTKESEASEIAKLIFKNSNVGRSLDMLGDNSGLSSVSFKMPLIDLLINIHDNIQSFAVPVIYIPEDSNGNRYELGGYAIITNGKFVNYIDENIARGYNIVMNKPSSSVIELPLNERYNGAVMLETSDSEFHFNFNGDALEKITIKVHFSTYIQDVQGILDLHNSASWSELQSNQNKVIKDEIQSVVSMSKNYKSDFLKIGKSLGFKHPYKWGKIKENWHEILADTPIEIQVSSVTARTYEIADFKKES